MKPIRLSFVIPINYYKNKYVFPRFSRFVWWITNYYNAIGPLQRHLISQGLLNPRKSVW